MPIITDVGDAWVDIDESREPASDRICCCRPRSSEIVAVYSEERLHLRRDSGPAVMIGPRQGGATATDREVVLPFTDAARPIQLVAPTHFRVS